MESNDIWTNIIIPLLIGPLFLYLKSVYDVYINRKNEHKLMLYNNKYEHLTYVLNNFYWPLYLKLLCITQLTYNIPLKNDYEYYSDSDESDNKNSNNLDNDNFIINIKSNKNIVLNTETIQLMELNMNLLFHETIEIIEKHVYKARLSKNLNKHIVQFIKYCKIREIIREGSIDKKYNIEYFGIKDNTKKLLQLIETDVNNIQEKYNCLIEKGP